jgi:hypothetical protein
MRDEPEEGGSMTSVLKASAVLICVGAVTVATVTRVLGIDKVALLVDGEEAVLMANIVLPEVEAEPTVVDDATVVSDGDTDEIWLEGATRGP